MSKAPTPAPANTKVMDTIKSFAFGGIAGCIATSVI